MILIAIIFIYFKQETNIITKSIKIHDARDNCGIGIDRIYPTKYLMCHCHA